jgi:hypothetical protein
VPGTVGGYLLYVVAHRWPEQLPLMALFGTDPSLKAVNAFAYWVFL